MINLTREEAQKILDALEYAYDNEMFVDIRVALRAKLSEPEPEQMTSSSIARARQVAGLLRERNIQTWDDTDREAVFAIDALVSFASMLLNHRLNSVRPQPEPTIDGWPLYSGLPQPEPVAYIDVETRNLLWAKPTKWKTPTTVKMDKILLYTAPPQRKWVGLTNAEYEAMAEQYVTNCYFDTLKYAKAIEAKLMEKNG